MKYGTKKGAVSRLIDSEVVVVNPKQSKILHISVSKLILGQAPEVDCVVVRRIYACRVDRYEQVSFLEGKGSKVVG